MVQWNRVDEEHHHKHSRELEDVVDEENDVCGDTDNQRVDIIIFVTLSNQNVDKMKTGSKIQSIRGHANITKHNIFVDITCKSKNVDEITLKDEEEVEKVEGKHTRFIANDREAKAVEQGPI